MQSPYNVIPSLPPDIFESHLNILTDRNASNNLLWRTSYERQQEYFEVDIFNDQNEGMDVPFEKSMDEILNLNKYTCHICNIEVPNGYMKEHNSTEKHKICNEIANIALTRTKLQIELEVDTSRRLEVSDTYFCGICSIVVLNSEKEKHEQDKIHKTSLKHDEMLSDMLKIYSDRDNVEVISEIDELELLRQRLDSENHQEDSDACQQNSDEVYNVTKLEQTLTNQLKEGVFNMLKDEFKSAIDKERETIEIETKKYAEKAKIQLDTLVKHCNTISELLNEKRDNSSSNNTPVIQKNPKTKALKKSRRRKQKERFLTACGAKECLGTENDNTLTNLVHHRVLQSEETFLSYSDNDTLKLDDKEAVIFENNNNIVVVKGEQSFISENSTDFPILDGGNAMITEMNTENVMSENQNPIITQSENELLDDSIASSAIVGNDTNSPINKIIRNKIDEVLAKFFNKSYTVDALNKSTDREHIKKVNMFRNNKRNRKNKGVKEQNTEKKTDQSQENMQYLDNEHNNNENVQITDNLVQNLDYTLNKDNQEQNENTNQTIQNTIKDDREQEINKEQVEYKTEAVKGNKEPVKDYKEQAQDNKEQDNYNQEQHNNKTTEQNKNKNSKTKSNSRGINKNVEVNKNVKGSNEPLKPEKSHTPNFNLVYYLKDIAWRCQTKPIHTAEAITDTIILITAINGDKIRVLVNSFHSFHAKAQNTYCKICERSNVRRPEWHIIESEHRAKVMIPIKDQNGIRKLDDIWSHCILCNDLTKNLDFHLKSLLHKNKLKHSLVELGKNDTDSDDSCHNSEASGSRSKIKTPLKRKERDVAGQAKHIPKEHQAKIAVLMLKNNLVMTTKSYLSCVVCSVIVNYDLTAVNQHVNSFVHLTNFERELDYNKVVDVGEQFYCIPCDVNVTKEELVAHCNGRRHKKTLQEMLNNEQGSDTSTIAMEDTEIVLPSISQNVKKLSKDKLENAELICFVCNTVLFSVDEHMDSFDHKQSYYTYLEGHKLNEIEPDTYYCIPCNTVITIDYLMGHCNSRKHCATLRNFTGATDDGAYSDDTSQIASTLSEVTYIVTPTLNVNDKSMPLKVLYQFREMADASKLLCTVCFEEIMYTRKEAEYHVSTLDHVVSFNLMMLWNKIKKRDDKYFCDICRLDMTYFSEITHVLGKQHANNLAKEPKGTVYEYDRTLVTHAYAMSHKVGDRTRPSSVISIGKTKK